MAKRNGGIIGKVNTPTLSVASGVWANQDQFNARVGNIWPKVTYQVDFLVIAGGGGGGANAGTGAGAGGYRTSYGPSGGGAAAESKLTLTPGNVYTITVGAGGPNTGRTVGGYPSGVQGSNSSMSGTGITTITSTGGGYGAAGGNAKENGGAGGSGGGGASYNDGGSTRTGGAGTANQGFKGGDAAASGTVFVTGGGGGAGGAGTNISSSSTVSSAAGPGLALSITGSSVTRAVGGRGYPNSSGAGTANTGNGGGDAFAGGSGVVILRMATASYSGTTTGSPTVTTSGSDTILQFNASGSYTA